MATIQINFEDVITDECLGYYNWDFVPRLNEYIVLNNKTYMVEDVCWCITGEDNPVITCVCRNMEA